MFQMLAIDTFNADIICLLLFPLVPLAAYGLVRLLRSKFGSGAAGPIEKPPENAGGMESVNAADHRLGLLSLIWRALTGPAPWLRVVLIAAAVFYAVVVYYRPALEDGLNGGHQWDFGTYYQAARLAAEGGDPYLAHERYNFKHPYTYPPYTVKLFAPFVSMDLHEARQTFFILKLAVLGALALLWALLLIRNVEGAFLLLLVAAYGFHKSLLVELESGNVNLFEIALIWGGVGAFARRKPVLFALCILAAALCKFWPFLLIGMLLFFEDRRSRIVFIAACLAFFALNFGSYLFDPEQFARFAETSASRFEELELTGWNPSALSFFRFYRGELAAWSGWNLPPFLDYAGWGLFAFAVFAVYWETIVRRRSIREPMEFALFTLFAYALILPRFKDFSFVLLLAPAVYVLQRKVPDWTARALLLLLVCVNFHEYVAMFAASALYLAFAWSQNRPVPGTPAS